MILRDLAFLRILSGSSITKIMVNGPGSIFIEKTGKISKTSVSFPDKKRFKIVIDRIVSQDGQAY
jgi:pilus assembly protein CpaF